jgi:glycosyltransferase involved in cell wall biosynthesis
VDREYFEARIRPRLDHPLIEYIGEVDERGKNELLGGAKALIFPIAWPEPFGLVMIEAMACGTPVIAYRRGSVAEVMKDGVTGYIVESEEQAVSAIDRIERIDRGVCRSYFEHNFSSDRMARNYVNVYQKLILHQENTLPGAGTYRLDRLKNRTMPQGKVWKQPLAAASAGVSDKL